MDSLPPISFLQGLSPAEVQKLSGLLETREVPAGERILEEGTPVSAFYIVLKGKAHVRRMAQKREMLLGRITEGGFFGEINLFDSGLATASIYAVDPVTLGVIDHGTLRAFMEANPATGYKIVSGLMREMAVRLRQTNERFVNSVFWGSLSAS